MQDTGTVKASNYHLTALASEPGILADLRYWKGRKATKHLEASFPGQGHNILTDEWIKCHIS